MLHRTLLFLALGAALCGPPETYAQNKQAKKPEVETPTVYPLAILPFRGRDEDTRELASKVTDLLFAELVANPDLYLVEREDLQKVIEEQELNLSGLVDPAQATKVGHLTGARLLITGSTILAEDNLYFVAKIIGTETGRVLGASVKGRADDALDKMVAQLAGSITSTISERASELVAQPVRPEDRVAALQKALGKSVRPSVWIDVAERHLGGTAADPAAEAELTLLCRALGFEVIDRQQGSRDQADILLLGEGFSQFASRHGNLVSVKARVELKVIERESGRVRAIDRQVSVAVDLAEQIAGKAALQDAAARLAERLLPAVVTVPKK